MTHPIPLFILGGSDTRRGPLHQELSAEEVLSGFKGALPLPTGRCLAAELIDRYRQTGRFRDPILLGPRETYRDLVDCEIVDVRGPLATTLACLCHEAKSRWPSSQPIAVSACDILPTADEIRHLLETGYDVHPDCKFWWEMVVSEPEGLGASSWKPKYPIRRNRDQSPESMYPGHLLIFRPDALRLEAWIRILALAYKYRNRPVRQRILPMLFRGLMTLATQDVRNLGRGQIPILTLSIPWQFLRAVLAFQRRTLTISEFEHRIGQVLLHRSFRGSPDTVVVTLTEIRSFAQDIDSEREYEALRNENRILTIG